MISTNKRLKALITNRAGPKVTEYAVMLSLIILGAMAGSSLLGIKVNGVFTFFGSGLPSGTG